MIGGRMCGVAVEMKRAPACKKGDRKAGQVTSLEHRNPTTGIPARLSNIDHADQRKAVTGAW